ncbi:decarboxylase [Candidatus Woesearchaeota archaeon]|nr:decarboxylase [Candidatus Woesearchaeota archaeon]
MAKFILSKSKVLEQYNILTELCDEVIYSFKTNQEVGKILENETNCKLAVHTTESLEEIKEKNRVWFFAQAWNENEINSLIDKVHGFVVDNEADLIVLLDFLKNKNFKINLALRMRLKENTIHTGKHFVFGMYSNEVDKWVKELKNNKNISTIGIHFHRKTQNVSEWNLKLELEEALSQETLDSIDFLNIGGGIPWNYRNYNMNVLPEIFNKIKELRSWFKGKLFLEPGRFIAAPSIKLETEIKSIDKNNITIDCSVFNGGMDTFLLNIRLLLENESEEGEDYTIKGITPDSLDIFRYKVKLKNKPKVGNKLIFLDAGAYNFSTNFCNLKKLETEIGY